MSTRTSVPQKLASAARLRAPDKSVRDSASERHLRYFVRMVRERRAESRRILALRALILMLALGVALVTTSVLPLLAWVIVDGLLWFAAPAALRRSISAAPWFVTHLQAAAICGMLLGMSGHPVVAVLASLIAVAWAWRTRWTMLLPSLLVIFAAAGLAAQDATTAGLAGLALFGLGLASVHACIRASLLWVKRASFKDDERASSQDRTWVDIRTFGNLSRGQAMSMADQMVSKVKGTKHEFMLWDRPSDPAHAHFEAFAILERHNAQTAHLRRWQGESELRDKEEREAL